MVNVNSDKEKLRIANTLIGKTFTIMGSDSKGTVFNMDEGKHLVGSSNNPTRTHVERRRALSLIDKILSNAIYVEKHKDYNHPKDRKRENIKYIEMYTTIKHGNDIYRFRIVAREGKPNSGLYTIGEAHFFDIIKEDKLSAHPSINDGHITDNLPSNTISVSQLLKNVKDREGKPYVNPDGTLNYNQGVLYQLPSGEAQTTEKKFSITEKDRTEKYEKLPPHQAAEEINRDAYLYGELESLTGEATKKSKKEIGTLERSRIFCMKKFSFFMECAVV